MRNAVTKKSVRLVALGVLLAIVVSFPMATYASASALAVRRRVIPLGSSPIWSTGYESGSHSGFTGPNGVEMCGNNPGEISTFSHTGNYSGYYYFTDPTVRGQVLTPGQCRSYYAIEPWKDNSLTTRDYYIELWVYVPSVTLSSSSGAWVSFITIEYQDWSYALTVNSGNDRQLFLDLHTGFTDSKGYQTRGGVQWPFDKWFKIGLEVHYRPASEVSTIILYQDDQRLVRLDTHARDPQPLNVWMLHFGIYTGGQQRFAAYNDEIAFYDLT